MAAVLLVGGYNVIHGSLSLGSFFAVNGYLLLLVVPLRSAGMWVGQYQRAMASGERIFEVLDVDRDIVEPPGGGAAARRARATSASRRSSSATRPTARCCAASTSTSRPAARSP